MAPAGEPNPRVHPEYAEADAHQTQAANACEDEIDEGEARHEEGYKRFMDKIFEVDPNGAVLAFAEMMKRNINMPAERMLDDRDPDLFEHFELVAQRCGVYTAYDYADIIDHLINRWNLESIAGLNSEASEGQDYLCNLSKRYRKLADRIGKRIKEYQPIPFSWIFDRAV